MVCRFSIFLLFLTVFTFPSYSVAQDMDSAEGDRAALVTLYNATDGPTNWTKKTGWLTNPSLRNWFGVTGVDSDGRVTRLDLWENQLSGTIPEELRNLSNLRVLNLYRNQLSGTIPEELGDLSNLAFLSLDTNQLSGTIPEKLGELSNLVYLNLFKNQLSGQVPEELGELSNLLRLDLSDNKLSGQVPEKLGELGELSKLVDLALSNNQLSGMIPEELGDLSVLLYLNLDTNQLSGTIPEELGDLSKLSELNLSDNKLSGQIPEELGDLSNLSRLNLGDNKLSGQVPEELGGLSDLKILYLHENQLSGSIPTELGDLTKLNEIALWGNEFTGEIPEVLGIKVDRAALRFFYQGTGGAEWTEDTNWLLSYRPLFSEWYGVTADADGRATGLNLNNNGLKGEIPVALGALANLENLDFADNAELTGALPLNLMGLSSLATLNISNTGLCVPTVLKTWLDGKMIASGRDTCVAVSVSFGESVYMVTEGGSATVNMTLNVDPERTVEIPLTVEGLSTAGNADYSVPASVTFASGETSKDITVTTTDNSRYQGNKTVVLAFDMPLPPDVSESTPSSTTVTIRDDERRRARARHRRRRHP